MGHGPWNAKPAETRTRERTREHGRMDALSLNDYLANLLQDDAIRTGAPITSPEQSEHASERIQNFAQSIEDISRRMRAGDNRSAQALAGVDQTLLSLLNRLESQERSQYSLADRLDNALDDIRTTQASLEERFDAQARKDKSRRMLDAMQALEVALSRLSRQVHETNEKNAVETNALRENIDAVTRRLDDTLINAAARMDRAIEEASKRSENLEQRVHENQRDVQAATERLNDVADKSTRLERQTENRLRELTERTEGNADTLKAQERKQTARLDELEERTRVSMKSIENRLETTDTQAQSALRTANASSNEVREQLKSFAEHTDRKLVEVEKHAQSAQQNITSVFGKLSDVSASVEKLSGQNVSSQEALANLEAAMARINERIEEAEETKASALASLEESFSSLDERLSDVTGKVDESAQFRDELQQKVADITDSVAHSMDTVRAELEAKLKAADSPGSEAIETIQRQMEDIQTKLAETDERQLQAVDLITTQFERMSKALDERLSAVEDQKDGSNVRAQLEAMGNELARVAEHLNNRVSDTERRSAEAIEQVGEHVVRAAERLQARNDEALDDISKKVAQSANDTKKQLQEAMDDVDRRLEEMRRSPSATTTPIAPPQPAVDQQNELAGEFDIETGDDAPPPPFASDVVEDDDDIFAAGDFSEGAEESLTSSPEEVSEPAAKVSLDTFISQTQVDETDDNEETTSPTEALAPVIGEDEVLLDAEEEDTPAPFGIHANHAEEPALSDADISSAVHDARKEFAAHLAEHVESVTAELQDDTDDDVFEDLTEDLSDFIEPEKNVFEDDVFAEDTDTDLFSSSDETEFEADLPQPDALLYDRGLDDDPFAKAGSNPLSVLNNARQAAKERGNQNRHIVSGNMPENGETRSSKLPIVAAGVLAVAVAGGAGMMSMRGKQANNDDVFTPVPPKFDPSLSAEKSAGDVDTDDGLFESDTAAPVTNPSIKVVEEDILSTDDAKILTSENIQAAEVSASPTTQTKKKVSALDAFASERTKQITQPATSVASPATERPLTIEEAATNGEPIALHDQAVALLAKGEKREAAETMRRAADEGLAAAQYRMGKLYERGEGVPRSMLESRKWTRLAADQGNVKAMHDLAVFYAEGEGGEQSFVGAAEWFTKAAEYGLVDSQYNLGVLYERGLGVSENAAEAAFWFDLAGRSGDADGARRARDIYRDMTANTAVDVQSRASRFVPKTPDAVANGDFGVRPWARTGTGRVAEVQRLLTELQFEGVDIDGVVGPRTRQAIRAFQEETGLPQTGEVDDQLLEKLESAAQNAR